jgi:hypothetical protein
MSPSRLRVEISREPDSPESGPLSLRGGCQKPARRVLDRRHVAVDYVRTSYSCHCTRPPGKSATLQYTTSAAWGSSNHRCAVRSPTSAAAISQNPYDFPIHHGIALSVACEEVASRPPKWQYPSSGRPRYRSQSTVLMATGASRITRSRPTVSKPQPGLV